MRAAEQRLRLSGDEDAEADVTWLMCACMHCKPSGLKHAPEMSGDERARFENMLARRESGEPLQYILGDQPFLDWSFKVDARALIPRPETEELCLKVLELMRGMHAPYVLDVGTGTGAIAVSVALKRSDSRVTAVDISPDALSLARENARELHADVEFIQSDLLDGVRGRRFDVIVSNPPYLTKDDMDALQKEVRREPALALYGGEDGLDFYRRLAKGAPDILNEQGYIAFEVGAGQAGDVSELLQYAFEHIEICRDINGVERMVCARRRAFERHDCGRNTYGQYR